MLLFPYLIFCSGKTERPLVLLCLCYLSYAHYEGQRAITWAHWYCFLRRSGWWHTWCSYMKTTKMFRRLKRFSLGGILRNFITLYLNGYSFNIKPNWEPFSWKLTHITHKYHLNCSSIFQKPHASSSFPRQCAYLSLLPIIFLRNCAAPAM